MFVAMERGVRLAGRSAALDSAKLIQRQVDTRVLARTGSDRVLSGMTRSSKRRRKGRPIRIVTKPRLSGPKPSVLVSAKGPMPLIENDIAPHTVVSQWVTGPARLRRNAKGKLVESRRKSSKASRIAAVELGLGAAGGGRRAVMHWGNVWTRYVSASSKGTQPWRKGVDEVKPKIGLIHGQAQRSAIARAALSGLT